MSDALQTYLEAHRNVAPKLPGAAIPWVRRVRDLGLARFEEVGFPTLRDEDWKYTNVRPLAKQAFTPEFHSKTKCNADQLKKFTIPNLDTYRLVFLNGLYAPELSDLDRLPSGISIVNLSAALENSTDDIATELGRYVPSLPHAFIALNTAFLIDGAYVRIGRNCLLDRPIELLYVSVGDGEPAMVSYPRNLIIAEANSQAAVLERYVSLADNRYFTNAITELVAHASASVDHYKLQEESTNAFHVGGLFVHQERDSTVTTNNIAVGGAIARTDLVVALNATGARSYLNGLYIATGRQHIDNHTQVDHQAVHCTSDEYYKGVIDGRARAVFHGRVVVHQDAQHSDAQQQNKNLLLSENAEVDTKPQLEIYADNVKCSHGATVGQLDLDAVFYLRSRAIDEKTARNLLTYAFANDVLNRLTVEEIRHALEQRLATKLLRGERIENLV